MSDRPLAYGVDFGTTNTVVAVAYPNRTQLVPIDDEPVMPSVMYLHRDGVTAAGHPAIRQFLITGNYATRCGDCDRVAFHAGQAFTHCNTYRPGGGCRDSRVVTSIKSELTSDRSLTHSWGTDYHFSTLVEIILRHAKQAADRALRRQVNRAVIGFPIAFPGAEGASYEDRQQRAMQRLEEAARQAGFTEVVFLEEPVAALTGMPPQGTVVACDFGGGTFDVAVMQGDGHSGEVVGLRGADVGGSHVDEAIFDAKVAPAIGLPPAGTSELRQELRTLNGALHVLRVPALRTELRDRARDVDGDGFAFMEAVLEGGFAYDLYQSIERAKIRLSTVEETFIELRRPRAELAVPLKRAELDELLAPLLDPVERALDDALDDAGVAPQEVDFVTRTGGASQMPAFVGSLQARFGSTSLQAQSALTAIAEGLATHARGEWG